MSNITIALTPAQEKFLKLFAERHYPGAFDNLATDIPIHVVQNTEIIYIPVNEDYAEDETESVVFSSTMFSNDEKFKSPEDLVTAYYKDEQSPIKIRTYKETKDKPIIGVDGETHYIYSYAKYFGAYGIEAYGIDYVYKSMHDVAFFFILNEAQRYIEYQAHNLKEPRIFSFAPGYGNEGEYRHFYELLRNIGTILLEQDSHEKPEAEE